VFEVFEFANEEILKICQYLLKLRQKLGGLLFGPPFMFTYYFILQFLRIGPKMRPQRWCALCTRPEGKVSLSLS